MIRKSEAAPIAIAMLARAKCYGANITWNILSQDIPANMTMDRERHSAFDGFRALECGQATLTDYLRRSVSRLAS